MFPAGPRRSSKSARRGDAESSSLTDVGEERDVSDPSAISWAEFGRIDVLYNNAAVLFHDRDARAHELSLELWDQVMRMNLRGAFLCSKHVIPFMLKQGGGSIINLGSPTGMTGCAPNLTAYSTSKAGILGLTRAMAAAYARDGIRVNIVDPRHHGYADERSSAGRRGNPGAIPGSSADGALWAGPAIWKARRFSCIGRSGLLHRGPLYLRWRVDRCLRSFRRLPASIYRTHVQPRGVCRVFLQVFWGPFAASVARAVCPASIRAPDRWASCSLQKP